MFAVVAVVACCFGWLGAEWKVVHARRSAWQRIEGNGGIVSASHPGQWSGVFLPNGVHVRPRKPLSWIRTKLGDLPVMGILLSAEDSSSSSVEQIRQLFPEAAVVPEPQWKNPAGKKDH
jgi:hypothetical protein